MYYGSRFSPNMTRTPEGYLVCHNVPIARTGWYDYRGQDIGKNELYNKKVEAYRSVEEVFSPSALASFEGKPVTDNHPTQSVSPDNYNSYLKGTCTNVRKGKEEFEDCVVADLIIYDPILDSEIEAGKRQVSCGYDCTYEEIEEGKYKQINICGNHIAIVTDGRAGDRIAIQDSKTIIEGGKKTMSNKPNIWGRLLKSFAKDEATTPDDMTEAVDAINAPNLQALQPKAVDEPQQQQQGSSVEERLSKIEATLEQLIQSDKQVHAQVPKNALDALEGELEGKENATDSSNNEESVTVPAESMVENKENQFSTDKATVLQKVRDAKKEIAKITDVKVRDSMSEVVANILRPNKVKTTDSQGYVGIQKAIQYNAQKTQDSNIKGQKANDEFKAKCDSLNPHINKGGK
jgi:hypothetical protein